MTWHTTHQTAEGSMCRTSNVEAWKHFDRMYPDFTKELRNVRLGLCTDGFAPHDQYDRTYSCWPVIITPYNLSPGRYMSFEYMFLMMVIPGLSNLKRLIDVYLEPLIEELLQLWHVGVRTYDHATNRASMIRAALMWTMNDLPVYGIASGWSTAGIMGCPVCMDDTRAFHLQHGRKACYFDCHRHFLPGHHPYRRNKKAFTKNRVKNKVARPRLIGDHILDLLQILVLQLKYRYYYLMAMIAITSGRRKASFGISHIGQHFLSDTILMSCTLKKMCLTIYLTR
ncbi:UNVERIFIED_CONTAM: hypothetical protein Sradi_0874900 [Sesamum radiatum]|uniref:Transposase n=1 Tax=Sesamum radiatum TaxID=300843 RepID=A0AAW2V728_SESRA